MLRKKFLKCRKLDIYNCLISRQCYLKNPLNRWIRFWKRQNKTTVNTWVPVLFFNISNQYCLRCYCDGQTNKGMNGARSMVPPWHTLIHTISLWRRHLSRRISRFSTPVSGNMGLKSQCSNKQMNQMLSCRVMNRFFCCCLLQRCHLERHKAHEHGKQKLLSVKTQLCVLNGLHPLIWAQQSSHRLVRWLCVCQPTRPALPPPFSSLFPSFLLPLFRPRPHWSAVPWLLPTDQSAWCLLCLGEVNKLLGQSNGKRGARRADSWPLNARGSRTDGWKSERGRHGGVREERRDETEG